MAILGFLPRGMVTRLALVLVGALAIELAGASLLQGWQERMLISTSRADRIAEQLATAGQVASHVPPAQRARLVAGLGLDGLSLNWVSRTVITDSSASHPQLAEIRTRIETAAPRFAGRELRLGLIPSNDGARRDLLGAFRIADGSFVTFRIHPFLTSPLPFAVSAMLHLLLGAAVLLAALLMVRALVRPLRDLAEAADATGRGNTPVIPVTGPWEVRRVAAAFRDMQARLLETVDNHTQALVAVSHDLRTPIQRLRLRTSLVADQELRKAMIADIVDMERFVGSVVSFLEDGSEEEDRLVDLPSLVTTMVDNASDAGALISYDGLERLTLRIKPTAFKRALGNLIDNACRHGEHVRVVVSADDTVAVTVHDDGPGIPPSMRKEAFVPFRRLHGKQGDGSGLGLSIARKAVESFNASIDLDESPSGGLAATIRLPVSALPDGAG